MDLAPGAIEGAIIILNHNIYLNYLVLFAEKTRGRRLDSSEVLILSPTAAATDSGVFDDSVTNGLNLVSIYMISMILA